jgi:multiple sugar transport system permease protein
MSRNSRNTLLGLAFLTPNILGFLAFTLIPLIFSMALAFSNWDLRLHNAFKSESLQFVGLSNFRRLLEEPNFWKYLGNTLFFMLATPFSIAGSLVLAMLLSKEMRGGSRKMALSLVASAVLLCGTIMLILTGMGQTAMVILLAGLACMLLVGGAAGGSTVYRTLFYLPSFTAGVPVYILWKKLYNTRTGPISGALRRPLASLSGLVEALPPWFVQSLAWVFAALCAALLILGLRRLRRMWVDGDLGWAAAIVPILFVLTPPLFVLAPALHARRWVPQGGASWALMVAAIAGLGWQGVICRKGRDFKSARTEGFGTAAMFALGVMVLGGVLVGLGRVCYNLPSMVAAAEGGVLSPPSWLGAPGWAKPAIMIMGFWMGVGSNNMLLYLAGLSNVPQELYEAADIDGASRFQRFWNVTWPQLAPTTFFIVVMSVIGGLQGGFEMARTMTQGGPAGATTTLSYFIYTEGFETGRLGYASAIAWTLFLLILGATLINWRFGNRYVND